MNNIEQAFIIADNAKYRNDYETANACFAYIFGENAVNVKYGYEYLPDRIDEETGEVSYAGEGIPEKMFDHDVIGFNQFFGLPFMQYNTHYMCIPAPLVSLWCFNKFMNLAKSKRDGMGFVERGPHSRPCADVAKLQQNQAVTLENVHRFIANFNVPSNVLEYKIGYENPNRIFRHYRLAEPLLVLPIRKDQLLASAY